MSQLRRVLACPVVSAALLFSPLAIAAPPEPAPGPVEPSFVIDEPAPAVEPAPTDPVIVEPAPTEPAPSEPAPSEPAPAPTVVEPAPSEALPTWDSKLPSYDAPLLPPDQSQSGRGSTPLDGNGLTVVGSMLLGGGVVLGATSGVLIVADSDEIGLWIAGATLSAAAVATGAALLAAGVKKRKKYKPWRLQHDAPPQGNGMFAGGTVLISASAFGVLLGTVSLSLQTDEDLPYGQVALSLSAIAAVTGVGLVVAGSVRGKRFDAWRKNQLTPSLGLLHTPQLQTAGATFGVAGRF